MLLQNMCHVVAEYNGESFHAMCCTSFMLSFELAGINYCITVSSAEVGQQCLLSCMDGGLQNFTCHEFHRKPHQSLETSIPIITSTWSLTQVPFYHHGLGFKFLRAQPCSTVVSDLEFTLLHIHVPRLLFWCMHSDQPFTNLDWGFTTTATDHLTLVTSHRVVLTISLRGGFAHFCTTKIVK